jgi:gliding motility-associated-like protein
MKKKILAFLFMLFFFLPGLSAQTFYQVDVLSGTQLLGSTTVTVVGTGGNYGYYNFCGTIPGPYLPGNTSPGNFLFTFSTPVQLLRITTHGMQSQEVNSIEINGATYTLGTANNLIVCPTCTGTCQDPIGSFVGGNLVGYPGSGGQFTITNVPGGISSVKFSNNGVQSGTAFSMEFQEGLPVEATNNGPVCWGDTLKLFGSPTVPSGTYSWTGPNGFSSSQQNPVIPNPTAADEGAYILTINGSYQDTTSVTLLPRPSNPVVTFDQPVCAGSVLNLSCSSTPAGADYSWSGPHGFSAATANPSIPNVQAGDAGVYTVQADINGCKSDTVSVTVEVSQPTESHTSKAICSGEYYNFNGKELNEPGNYVDSLVNAAGCDSFARLTLTIKAPLPLEITVSTEDQFCIGDTVTLTGHGAVHYFWNYFDYDLGSGASKNVRLIYLSNTYSLTGIDTNNCKGEKDITLQAKACCDIMVPNAFSPNNDGRNDGFGIKAAGNLRAYKMRVYDRLGQMIFVSFNTNTLWDGTINGKPANPGTYFYLITAKCDYGADIHKRGDITLIR